jgi:hypothetical protein
MPGSNGGLHVTRRGDTLLALVFAVISCPLLFSGQGGVPLFSRAGPLGFDSRHPRRTERASSPSIE